MENKENPFMPPFDISDDQDINEKIRELDELKNTFIALVSHELRTPLNLISGYLDLSLEELDKDPATAKKYLDIVNKNTKKMMDVVQELTDFSRLQLGKEITYLDPIPVEDAFLQTYDLLKQNLKAKNINLVADFTEDIRELEYDSESLIILFRNLLSNAAKFSPQEGKVLVVGKLDNDYLSISVHDWASPIPESKQETIFEDFRQLENYLTRRYEGMGLGLAVARRTARFLGGNIRLIVREDGNTFEVLLPIEPLKKD
ncbi:MAG: HAMP domain-containing histidine kinase [Anaerolineales bacterium]|nr:HAMP domain-containing histidine kinase [Anaerolineales bacterium]